MDVYRRGGDSLQGRYHHYRLHPFSVREALAPTAPATLEPGTELSIPDSNPSEVLEALLAFGGFPEPFVAHSERTLRRWQKERLDRFFREDVRDLEPLREMMSIQLLAEMLPARVGSPLSLNALREDLELSHRSVESFMLVLERLYHAVRVRPFASPRVRSLRKMPKAYLWDWSLVSDPGPRFENLVALHLLRLCHLLEDRDGHRAELWYLRERTGHEVDFLVTLDRKPWFAVETKLNETRIDPALRYFRDRLEIPFAYQVVRDSTRDFVEGGIRCVPAASFLAALA